MSEDPIIPESMINEIDPAPETREEPASIPATDAQETPLPDPEGEPRHKSGGRSELDEDKKGIIEALIFASEEPIPFREIKTLLEGESAGAAKKEAAETTGGEPAGENDGEKETLRAPKGRRRAQRAGMTPQQFRSYVEALNREYHESGRSFRIVEIAGGFTFQTTREFAPHVGRMFAEKAKRRLTHSALETLAIIAFQQPISKPAIESIRGVNADFVLKSLLEKELITIVGRDEGVGRPLLYGTTDRFLKHFGIARIEDLPKPREIEELLAEDEALGVETIEIEEMEKSETPEIEIPPDAGIFKTLPYGENFEFEQNEEPLPEPRAEESPEIAGDEKPAMGIPLRVQMEEGREPATMPDPQIFAETPAVTEPEQPITIIDNAAFEYEDIDMESMEEIMGEDEAAEEPESGSQDDFEEEG